VTYRINTIDPNSFPPQHKRAASTFS